MNATSTVRDLRNRFPAIRRLLEAGSEVVLTERGRPRYRLSLYVEPTPAAAPKKDYLARMQRHQPKPLSARRSKALHEDNRGDR